MPKQPENPPAAHGDRDRAAGPPGDRGTSRGDPDVDDPARAIAAEVELRSSAFTDHTFIPDRYSLHMGNISPPLEWGRLPDAAEELALLCSDPDAPSGTFTHWVLSNIAPDTTGADEGGVPAGSHIGRNGFGELGWSGPAPPIGDEPHRYFFRLYAADRPLGLAEGANADDLLAALDGHTLATGNLVGIFGR